MPEHDLSGKAAIVTGGNSGIGAAISAALAAAGASVVVDYVDNDEEATELVEEIRRGGGRAIAVQGDVSDPRTFDKLVAAAVETFGALDVLVNNAGVESGTSLLETTPEDYDRVMAINLRSAFFGTQAAARRFIAQGTPGVVINVSSIHEDWPMPGNAPYCVSKGGMRMLARNAASELGEHGIRVLNVCPGAVSTPINEETMEDPETRERLVASIPLGRVARPEDIGAIVTALASPAGAYVTGTSVVADGGMMNAGSAL